MGKIVYHGTFSDNPPHVYGGPFHAGTEQSARERLDEAEEYGGLARIHGYEIKDTAPTNPNIWLDPLTKRRQGPYTARVPENDTTQIHAYENEHEDEGSISYVIPSNFVGKKKHVTHLGPQFQELRGRGGEEIGRAAVTMLGGTAPGNTEQ
jgi:hypothetical protein